MGTHRNFFGKQEGYRSRCGGHKTPNSVTVAVILVAFLALGASGWSNPDRVETVVTAGAASTFADRFAVADSHMPYRDAGTLDTEFSRVNSAGIGWVRTVLAWSDMEPARGAWSFTAADRAVNAAQVHGVKVLGIIGFPPSWANGGQWPIYPPTDIPAWRNYVTTVCARYKDKVAAWEIWNEENITAFWAAEPTPDPNEYVALVKETYASVKAADPDSTVLMGGVAGLDPTYLDNCFKAGIADYIDAVAYHPFAETIGPPTGYTPKETMARYIVAYVRWLIGLYTTRPLQIWITEFGWTTYNSAPGDYPQGVDESTQASYMLRSLINYADTEVDRVVWYNMFDELSNPADQYGLLHGDLTTKPSFNYYKTFQGVFGSATSSAPAAATYSCSSPDTLETHSFNLRNGGLVVGAWKSDDADDQLTVTLDDPNYVNPVTIDPATGSENPAAGVSRTPDGRLKVSAIAVGKQPVILKFGAPTTCAKWYLAEGTTGWGFETYLSIQNPNPSAVTADVTYMTKDGPVAGPAVSLPAASQATVFPKDTLGSMDFSTRVVCRQGKTIAVDRTMTWTGPQAVSQEAHSSIGVTTPARTWYLPEGSSNWGFECWLLIQNPNSSAAKCNVTYMVEGVGPVTFARTVPANSRASFDVAKDIGAADASIKVEADVPVIPERAMYRNNRRQGHDSTGTTAPAGDFYLAEGTTAWGFTTYVLVQNPNSAPNTVTITYMTPTGPVRQEPFTIPANSRRTIRVNDFIGATDFSTHVQGTHPLVTERAMYWGGDTAIGEACHDSIGIAQPHTRFYLPDGQSSNGRETWTLVQNPNATGVRIEISYMTPTGVGNVLFEDTVPANSRKSYDMAKRLSNGRGAIMVTSKTAGQKIIVERAMYWNSRGAGTDTLGGFSD